MLKSKTTIMDIIVASVSSMEYGENPSYNTSRTARNNGIIIVYGYSDDLMVIQGAIDDEFHVDVFVDQDGVIENKCDSDSCPHYETAIAKASRIKRSEEGGIYVFTPLTHDDKVVKHVPFTVMEDDQVYCYGFVAYLEDFRKQ